MAEAAWRKNARSTIAGVPRRIVGWRMDTLCDDRSDPDWGWAIAELECGHIRAARRLYRDRREPPASLTCVACLPSWLVHLREIEAAAARARRADRSARRASAEAFRPHRDGSAARDGARRRS